MYIEKCKNNDRIIEDERVNTIAMGREYQIPDKPWAGIKPPLKSKKSHGRPRMDCRVAIFLYSPYWSSARKESKEYRHGKRVGSGKNSLTVGLIPKINHQMREKGDKSHRDASFRMCLDDAKIYWTFRIDSYSESRAYNSGGVCVRV